MTKVKRGVSLIVLVYFKNFAPQAAFKLQDQSVTIDGT